MWLRESGPLRDIVVDRARDVEARRGAAGLRELAQAPPRRGPVRRPIDRREVDVLEEDSLVGAREAR